MRKLQVPRGTAIGIGTALLLMLVLSALTSVNATAVAQEETPVPSPTPQPTATATLTPTPVPTFELQAQTALLPEGDVNSNGIINPGDTVQYMVTLTNVGEPSGPVRVIVTYDQAFVSGIANITAGGAAGEGQVVWDLAVVSSAEQVTLAFDATLKRTFPSGRTQITGSISVRDGTVELARGGIPAFEVVGPNLRLVEQTSEMITDADENGRIDPGDTVRFVITYSNTGGGPSQDASIVASYPIDFTSEIVANPDNATVGEGTLTWLIGSIPADSEIRAVQFDVRLSPDAPAGMTTYDVNVSLSSMGATLDSKPISVKVSGPNFQVAPAFTFAIDQNEDGLADVGDQLDVTIIYTNVGTDSASNVVFSVTYNPERLTITNLPGTAVHNAETGVISWSLPTLDTGREERLSFLATVTNLPVGAQTLKITASVSSDQTRASITDLEIPVLAPTPTLLPSATPEPIIQETRPAQGQGILAGSSVAILIGAFLLLSLLSLAYVASRVLPGSSDERVELDTEEERAANRRLVRELIEGVVLTAILFSVMVLGLQNALDQDSVNSIIAGIVGYVAGRVSSQK